MVIVTGDQHGSFNGLRRIAYDSAYDFTRNDVVIVCGDFGIWTKTMSEKLKLDNLTKLPFTIAFVDGNHENFDRLYSNEFPFVDFNGAKAHKIRENVFHIMRGEIMTLEDKKYFCFGGASSHDIQDGIVDRKDFESDDEYYDTIYFKSMCGEMFRVNHESWWKEEIPSEKEMRHGTDNLKKHNFKVDYVISHCCADSVQTAISASYNHDILTRYFQKLIDDGLQFKRWYFGHYHEDRNLLDRYTVLYHSYEEVR